MTTELGFSPEKTGSNFPYKDPHNQFYVLFFEVLINVFLIAALKD